MVQLTVSMPVFMIIWILVSGGMIAAGWFLRGWYDAPSNIPPPPPEEDFGGKKGKW